VRYNAPGGGPGSARTANPERAPLLVGVAIVVAAALAIGAIALRGEAAPRADAPASAAAAPVPAGERATAAATANLYSWPDRSAEVAAIVPAGRQAALLARSEDGAWLLVAYPPDGGVRGWVHASAFGEPPERTAALPLASATAAASSGERERARALPDLVIAEALLLQGGRLAVVLRNLGAAPVTEATVTLHVSTVAGELVGVLRIGPATLAPGGAATVVTPLSIAEPGSYRIELDPANELAEAQDGNNALQALLVPAGG
jgi:hypothetical protein